VADAAIAAGNPRRGRPGRRFARNSPHAAPALSALHKRKAASTTFPTQYAPNVVRVVPLGGVEEVGRNMCAVEVGNDIFVIDAGFQFVSEDGSPGVDYVLPNTKYLEKNQERVRGVIITHGHLDHIGAIPFIMNRFGNPPIYTQNLTAIMIQKRQEEYPDMPAPQIVVVEAGSTITIGSTKVKFFPGDALHS
jgi:ribonuclease J